MARKEITKTLNDRLLSLNYDLTSKFTKLLLDNNLINKETICLLISINIMDVNDKYFKKNILDDIISSNNFNNKEKKEIVDLVISKLNEENLNDKHIKKSLNKFQKILLTETKKYDSFIVDSNNTNSNSNINNNHTAGITQENHPIVDDINDLEFNEEEEINNSNDFSNNLEKALTKLGTKENSKSKK